tara:strand:+ start:8881 stop:9093 length:213 start_codon:yes stop_codon:yes gene_type:complete
VIDIGALWFSEDTNILGDCNSDGISNILDVVYLVNICIINSDNACFCGDLNEDAVVNVLDVVILINLILL